MTNKSTPARLLSCEDPCISLGEEQKPHRWTQASACTAISTARTVKSRSPAALPSTRLRTYVPSCYSVSQSRPCQSLTVDFYDVAYIDTSGLAVLVETLKAARDQGKTFHLSRLRERPRYLLEASRLLHLFDDSDQQSPPSSVGV